MLGNLLAKPKALITIPSRGVRVTRRRHIQFAFENERKQFEREASKMRRQHMKDYWEMQTQVETQYLRDFKEERIGKMSRDMNRWRTQICNIALMTEKKLDHLQEREDKILETMQKKDIEEGKRLLENKYKLDAMTMDSQRWPKLDDLENTIATNIIVPQTVMNHAEYQRKLQRLAFFAEQGDFEAMQSLLDKEESIDKKNKFLTPLYKDLKASIKNMTYSDEYKLMREYIYDRARVLETLPAESKKAKKEILELQKKYALELRNTRKQMATNINLRLSTMEKRLKDIFQLLELWTRYVDIIYASESEMNILSILRDDGLFSRVGTEGMGADELSLAQKLQEENIEERLKSLFSKETIEELEAEEKNVDNTKADYESVEEGLTTDTPLTSESDGLHQRQSAVFGEELSSAQEDKPSKLATGIMSSDEESAAEIKAEVIDEPTTFNKNKLFKNEREKDILENRFGFDDDDLDQFGDQVLMKTEQERRKKAAQIQALKQPEDEVDYLGTADIVQDVADVDEFNLFGVPLSELGGHEAGEDETVKDKNMKRKFVKQLIMTMEQLDEEADPNGIGLLQDFSKQKMFNNFDIFNPEQALDDSQYTSLKYDASLKNRASLVMDVYENMLADISPNQLTYEEKEKFQNVSALVRILKNVRIVDASVLLKIYNLHRCQL